MTDIKVQSRWAALFFIFTREMPTMRYHTSKVLLSTSYFPPVWYFFILHNSAGAKVELYETYPKQTLRNRCEIYSANGLLSLSVPVERPDGNRTRVNQVRISRNRTWQRQHIRAIDSAYNSSPFYIYYKDDILEFFTEPAPELLVDHNQRILERLCNIIGISTQIELSRTYEKEPADLLDFRHLTSKGEKEGLPVLPQYAQVFIERSGFLPNLSILDLLFNLGPDTRNFLEGK
jgi:hypothetical protein